VSPGERRSKTNPERLLDEGGYGMFIDNNEQKELDQERLLDDDEFFFIFLKNMTML
jgi:hypothetical protein